MSNDLKLNIPIYLDTNLLLDLLASIDDGFSAAKKITTDESESENFSKKGGIGFSYFLFDLGINLSKVNTNNQGRTSEIEKYHTYGSMMNKLLKYLFENDLINKLNDEEIMDNLEIHSFVEIQGKFIPNPVADSFKKIYNLMVLAKNFSYFDSNQKLENANNKSSKNNTKNKNNKRKTNKDMQHPYDNIIDLLKSLSESLEKENSQKYIIDTNFGFTCVLNLFNDYIRDNSGVELPFGNFKVLGKVIRIENDKLNLLEDTPYSLSDDFIKSLDNALKTLDHQLNLPEIKTEIEGKCIQIIPIAVYV